MLAAGGELTKLTGATEKDGLFFEPSGEKLVTNLFACPAQAQEHADRTS